VLAVLLALACLSAACSEGGEPVEDGGSEATAVPASRSGIAGREGAEEEPADEEEPEEEPPGPQPGILVWIHDREPPDLHYDDPLNGLPVTSWIRQGLLESLFGVDSTLSYYPELLAEEPEVVEAENGIVTISARLRDGLTWSDGVPLTAEDIAYTHRILTEGCQLDPDGSIVDNRFDECIYQKGDRSGLDLVTDLEVTGPTTFVVTMAAYFPGWRDLFGQIYAAHAFGETAADVDRNLRTMTGSDGPLPASGPLVFQRWDPGVAIELARNERYHGSVSPDATNTGPTHVDGVRIEFVRDPEGAAEAVLAGRAHLLMLPAQPDLARLADAPEVTVASSPGATWEHWGLNLLNPHLAKPEVRLALVRAIDKAAVVNEVLAPLVGPILPPEGLGNTYWLTNQPPYRDNQAAFAASDPAAAAEALQSAGYERGGDGVFRHPVDGRLSLRVGTTGGNALREQIQAVLQRQLADAGIEIVIDNLTGGRYFTSQPFADDAMAASASGGAEGDPSLWDIAQFAWVGGPWPGAQSGAYRSSGRRNPYGFNNAEFDVAASECDAVVADGERAGCYNDLDTFATTLDRGDDGLFIIPLAQKPSFHAYRSDLLVEAGVAPDTDAGGPMVNVVDHRLAESMTTG
jgi:peptide/nickel transport system substrate-binding protein